MAGSNQIKVYPYTLDKKSVTPLGSRDAYECANALITRGVTSSPTSLESCFDSFPTIKNMAETLGLTGTKGLWVGPPPLDPKKVKVGDMVDLLSGVTSFECNHIKSSLGSDWLGCLWGSPQGPFSCTCPEVGSKFKAYLKHRLNVATFWKTPKSVPVFRQSFLDYIKYQTKVEITVGGDFNAHPGMIVELKVESFKTKAPFTVEESVFSGLYIIVAVRHIINNGGTHETSLTLSYIPTGSEV
jgi:hypothetical protein